MAGQDNLHLDLDFQLNRDLNEIKALRQQQMDSDNKDVVHYSKFIQTQENVVLQRRIASGVSFVSLVAENLLSHPFQVLRRQCQVNLTSSRYHLLPFTLIPTVYHLHQHQGLTTLWKGIGSVLLVRGISLGIEDIISKVTPWPKDIKGHSSLKHFFQHTLLKCVSFAIATPFYSASFVETVQSDVASEKPGILDVFKEGFLRILNWNGGSKGRMLPIWVLIVPTVAYSLSKYLLTLLIKGASLRVLHLRFKDKHEVNGALPKDMSNFQNFEITASLIGNIASDIILFPCETIIHRLYLQGTRTIVDNLDNGSSVLPILTNFAGAIDCYENCLATEGKLGLYKGFGALIMQYLVHVALISLSRFFLTELGNLLQKPPKSRPNPTNISPAALSNLSEIHRSYLLP